MNYQDLMNIKEYIYLMKIEEPEENYLRLVFARTKRNKEPETIKIDETEISGCHPIEIDYEAPFIQLDFDWYIGYSTLNESFANVDDYEQYKGRFFRVYNQSHYLDYIRRATFADEDYPGPYKHYEMACLNHIIDVVSTEEPVVKEIRVKK